MIETRSFLCVSCPIGCSLTVDLEDGNFVGVSGNKCPMGASYARNEVKNPLRLFTSIVQVEGGVLPVCPVRSESPVPLTSMLDIAKALAAVKVRAPIRIGQIILPDVCGVGVDLVATRDLPECKTV